METRPSFFLLLTFVGLLLLMSDFHVSAQNGADEANISTSPEGVEVKTFIFPYGEDLSTKTARDSAAPWTDISVHGTMWTPELRGKFSMFRPLGWGTATKVKAAGNQWLHIPIPYITYLEDVAQKVRFVQFCAQSSNGSATKPTALHLWANGTRFYAGAVTWPADNAYHCAGVSFSPGVWKEDLGVSVSLHYANAVDSITLYKAWAQFER
jgi:hypothetical protein